MAIPLHPPLGTYGPLWPVGEEPLDIIYLDFAKAFDKVPHQRLLNKMGAMGILGNILRWTEAWLSNRQQKTVLNGSFSDWLIVLSGVPQGSVGQNNLMHTYSMYGTNLADTEQEQDIGVIVSNTLKPTAQCAEAARKAGAVLTQLTLWIKCLLINRRLKVKIVFYKIKKCCTISCLGKKIMKISFYNTLLS